MAISSSRVQGGGGNLMQQMSAEVVDLYKHFENLAQTRRQVDIMERQQKAKALSPMMDQLIANRGGEYAFLQTGPEAQALYTNYITELTGMKPEQAAGLVGHITKMDPSIADNIAVIRNLAGSGNEQALQMMNNFGNAVAYRQQAASRGDAVATTKADALLDQINANLEKLAYGTTTADAQKRQQQQQGTINATDREAEVRARAKGYSQGTKGQAQAQQQETPSTQEGKGVGGYIGNLANAVPGVARTVAEAPLTTLGGWTRWRGQFQENIGETIGGPFGEALAEAGRDAQQAGKDFQDYAHDLVRGKTGTPLEEVREVRKARSGEGTGLGGQALQNERTQRQRQNEPARGMWSQNVSTRQAFEAAKANGQIPEGTTFNEYIVRSAMPQGIQDSPEYVQQAWVEKNKKLLQIQQEAAEGDISPEEAQSQRMKAAGEVFQVQQQANIEQAASGMVDGPAKKGLQGVAKKVGESGSEEELLQKTYRDPATRPVLDDMLALHDQLSTVLGSLQRDIAKGKTPPKAKYKAAAVQAGGKLAAHVQGAVNSFHANLISSGAMDNQVLMRSMFPDLAKEADTVKQMSLAERKVAIAEDEMALNWQNFLWQKTLKEEMLELERMMAQAKAENPEAVAAMALLEKGLPGLMDFYQKAIDKKLKPNEVTEYVESIPLLKAIEEGAVNAAAPFGVQLEAMERELSVLQSFLSFLGKDYPTKYATPGFLGAGVNSAPVEQRPASEETGYDTGKWE